MFGLRGVFRRLPPATRQRLRRQVLRPAIWGNLRRREPISRSFGFDRGTPVDRYYLRRFLRDESQAIRGVVGEISESKYTERFGGDRVSRVEVIDVDAQNPRATLVADLTERGSLPASTFDCLLILQTLQYTSPLETALTTCLEALRPGGTLLLALPALIGHDPRIPVEQDHWRFLPPGVAALLATVAPTARCSVIGYGNLIAAIALLHGLSAEEVGRRELDRDDPRFPVIVCARVDLPRP